MWPAAQGRLDSSTGVAGSGGAREHGSSIDFDEEVDRLVWEYAAMRGNHGFAEDRA